ncbi:hypothetical protein ACA910_005114 [Epithemia clementina (nom. ined.)]
MFRPVSKKKNTRAARKPNHTLDDEEEESLEEEDTVKRIEQVKKKRKLLASVQNKRGVDAVELIHATRRPVPIENTAESASAETSTDGILDQKHRRAMEEFINSKLRPVQTMTNASNSQTEDGSPVVDRTKSLTEDALFSEISASALQLSGKDGLAGDREDREESGTGGAVLVAGTGIAEVVLPAQERVKLEQETEKAKAARYFSRRSKKQDPAPALPQAIPNRFLVSSHNSGLSSRPAGEEPYRGVPEESKQEKTPDVDDGRVGFEALKKRHMGFVERKPRNASNDHRVFQNFVTRQREMKK